MTREIGIRADLALQLFSLLYELKKNPKATLEWVAHQGFRNVEVAGFGNLKPAEFGQLVHDAGLKCIGVHAPDMDQFDGAPDFAQWCMHTVEDLNCKSFVVFRDRTSVRDPARNALDEYRYYHALADQLNAACEHLQVHGIDVAYHAYDFDFVPLGSAEPQSGLDVLFTNVLATNFTLQIDTYWAFCTVNQCSRGTGGAGLAACNRYVSRISSVHINDFDGEGSCVPFLEGICPWPHFFKQIRKSELPIKWILEHEPSEDAASAGTQKAFLLKSQTNWCGYDGPLTTSTGRSRNPILP